MKSSCRDLYEAENLSSFLANCFPDPERALTGISELLINAVEHGNLDISYEEKTKLVEENRWKDEVSRRLQDPVNNNKNVTVIFEKKGEAYYLQVTDQGKGFNWQEYLELDPSRASDNHGRGVAMANMIAFDRLVYNEKGNQVTGIMKIKSSGQETDDYWG
jgi:anti-sigma regulatory factor (Ser/Thr protein kinase)